MSSSLVALIVVANIAVAGFTAGRVLQRSERSLYRYRMWRIRDSIVDRVLSNDLRPTPEVLSFVRTLETAIDKSDSATPYRLARINRTLCLGGWKPPDRAADPAVKEQVAVREADEQAATAWARLVLLGSPSGWLLALVSVPYIGTRLLLRRFTSGEPKSFTRGAKTTAATWTRSHCAPLDTLRPFAQSNGKDADRHPAYT